MIPALGVLEMQEVSGSNPESGLPFFIFHIFEKIEWAGIFVNIMMIDIILLFISCSPFPVPLPEQQPSLLEQTSITT
jgi:hypothetical protein